MWYFRFFSSPSYLYHCNPIGLVSVLELQRGKKRKRKTIFEFGNSKGKLTKLRSATLFPSL
ncbi:hypothetical protein I79_006163 [Cricetulus griseus]|uniref:Uncharacterized protein n=1 Tax=Cricetulus griseus TaxID=10029 RepID=G3H738_CRIGR|nr:hypothetical protein I79_006163 [Cricetulus griseus]